MSLDDALESAASATPPKSTVLATTEFDGAEGFIQTGPMYSQPQTAEEFDDLLEKFGYDPDKVQVVGPVRTSRWQQRAEGDWLEAYRFRIVTKRDAIDLPALYAAVASTSLTEPVTDTTDSVAVVVFADPQIGKSDRLGGTQELIERLHDKRMALQEWLDTVNPERVVFVDAGDGVESFENTPSQPFTNDLSFPQQLDMYSTELYKFLQTCCSFAPTTSLIVPSNHGAWRNGKQNLGRPQDDWGLYVHKRVADQAESAGLQLEALRPDDWCESMLYDSGNARIGVTHGHQVGSPDRFPNWWASQTHGGQPLAMADIAITGHFHHLRVQPTGRNPITGRAKWWIQAPTLDNGSSWYTNRSGNDSDPGMVVFELKGDGFNLQTLQVL